MEAIYAKIMAQKGGIVNFLKWLTIPLVIFALYYQLVVKTDFSNTLQLFKDSLQGSHAYLFVFALLLMPFNLGAEALKWNELLAYTRNINFKQSYHSVLAGIALSIFTPKRLGEYGGRLIIVKENKREALLQLFVSNLSQSIANLIIGLVSLCLFVLSFTKAVQYFWPIVGFSSALIIVLLLVYFNLSSFVNYLMRFAFFRKHKEVLSSLGSHKKSTLVKLLGLSVVKYFIFILQFVLIIKAFGISVGILAGIVCASCVFFVKTMLPVPATIELAARGSIAIYFFSVFTQNNIGILVASILLWIINLGLPALIGSTVIAKQNLK